VVEIGTSAVFTTDRFGIENAVFDQVTPTIDAVIDEVKIFNRALSINEKITEQLKVEPYKRIYLL
jgi:hypothetical protein